MLLNHICLLFHLSNSVFIFLKSLCGKIQLHMKNQIIIIKKNTKVMTPFIPDPLLSIWVFLSLEPLNVHVPS